MKISGHTDLQDFKRLDGSTLKIIAVIAMLIDHIGVFVLSGLPQMCVPLFSHFAVSLPLYRCARMIGRIAFPIYCFLITEGYIHTHNRVKYGRNLLIFAVLSEIPWNYAFSGGLFYEKQNVFFTLFFGYLAICCIERFKNDKLIQIVSVVGLFLLSMYFKADYGVRGFLVIIIMYMLRNSNLVKSVVCVGILDEGLTFFTPFIFIGAYNGKRGFIKSGFLKYAFYAFYPLHILILGLIKWQFLK